MEARDSLVEKWPDLAPLLSYGDNAAAADCDVVVIATPWDSAATTAQENERRSPARSSSAWPTRSCAWATSSSRWCRRAAAWPPRAGRRAELPGGGGVPPPAGHRARSHRPADRQRRADLRRRCGRGAHDQRDRQAKIPGCRPLDAGELSNATAIEAFTAVLLQLNVRYKTRVAPKLTGIKGDPRAAKAAAAKAAAGAAAGL
jgi:hypothetical protein